MSSTQGKQRVTRFSVSMPPSLLARLDAMAAARGQENRSQAVAEMVRDRLVEHEAETGNSFVVGTITLVYDHHHHHLQEALTHIQHDHCSKIISTLHVHMDHDNCLEVLVVRGRAEQLRHLADHLITTRGVKHGKLTVTTTGRSLSH